MSVSLHADPWLAHVLGLHHISASRHLDSVRLQGLAALLVLHPYHCCCACAGNRSCWAGRGICLDHRRLQTDHTQVGRPGNCGRPSTPGQCCPRIVHVHLDVYRRSAVQVCLLVYQSTMLLSCLLHCPLSPPTSSLPTSWGALVS